MFPEHALLPEEPLFSEPAFGFGYHPVTLGQYLQPSPRPNFRVVRKLGHAAAGTVWLCEKTHNSQTYFTAVKILTVYFTGLISRQTSPERNILEAIQKHPNHAGYPHLLHLHQVFDTQSRIGGHTCFSTEVLGSSLVDLRSRQPNSVFSLPVAKRIIKQILQGLQLLHECGYVHNDLKTNNIMVTIPRSHDSTSLANDIRAYIGSHPPETYEPLNLPKLINEPIITVKSQPLPDFGLLPDLSNLNIKLIDYGDAEPIGSMTLSPSQPRLLCPPESILNFPWSTPSDVWAVGCIAMELVGDYDLFSQVSDLFDRERHIQQITELIGKIPATFMRDCPLASQYFHKNGEPRKVKDWDEASIETTVKGVSDAKHLNLSGLDQFLRACLIWDPRMRPTVLQLWRHPWLNGS